MHFLKSRLMNGSARIALGGLVAGAVVLGGLTIDAGGLMDRAQMDQGEAMATPFIDPAAVAQSICGPDAGGMKANRRGFISLARAHAAETASVDQAADDAAVPFWPGLGTTSLEITSDSELAQRYFQQGFRLMINFNHQAAIQSFKAAQAADPDCAMCYWAEGLSHGPNINALMFPEAVEPAYAATQKALSLVENATDLERGLIEALATRYAQTQPEDRSPLDVAYADAMEALADANPGNDNIQVLFAEAVMDTQPWDYWEADGQTPKGRMGKVIETLETVLARTPNHPAAIHLYIHAVEASSTPERAEESADRLAALMPGAGHIVHMPSHLYFRIGRYKDSLALNQQAVKADQAYLDKAEDASALYRFGYFTHNIHFVLTSAQMAGDAVIADEMAAMLDEKLPLSMAAAVPFAQPIKAAPFLAKLQFNRLDEVLALKDPGDDVPLMQALWRYARTEAYARKGKIRKAERELDKLEDLKGAEAYYVLDGQNIPATGIVEVAMNVAAGRIAMVDGDYDVAIGYLEDAVAGQDGLRYAEPPFWHYPIRQTLAAAQLMAGQTEKAKATFMQALIDMPNNGWAYYGLAEAYEQSGDETGAAYARQLFKRSWTGDEEPEGLAQL